MRAEIWVGNLKNEAYRIDNVKRIDVGMDGAFCKITTEDGYVFETSPHNVVIIHEPKEVQK